MAVIGLCGGEVELSGVRTVSLNAFHLVAEDGSCGCWLLWVCVFVLLVFLVKDCQYPRDPSQPVSKKKMEFLLVSYLTGYIYRTFVRRSMAIYVNDLLATLDSHSAPVYGSMIVVLCVCLGVPLSWKKTRLQSEAVWIGWQISSLHWRVIP